MSILNKKPSIIEDCNQDSYIIDENNLDFNTVLDNMPTVLADTVRLLKMKVIDFSDSNILNCCNSRIAQALTIRRPLAKKNRKTHEIIIPNWYGILFAPSGLGKDRTNIEINYILKDISDYFYDVLVQNYIQKQKTKIEEEAKKKHPTPKEEKLRNSFIQAQEKEIRGLKLTTTDGTPEGLFSLGKAFEIAGFGSLNIINPEFGAYLKNSTTDSKRFVDCLYLAYDGRVESKIIQGRNTEKDVFNLPVNVLLYSTTAQFKGSVKNTFNELLEGGFSRRTVITFQNNTKKTFIRETINNDNTYTNEIKRLKDLFFSIFLDIGDNSIFCFTEDAYYRTFQNYREKCINLANRTSNECLKTEIEHRPYKVLKTSCIYAMLNHPKTKEINVTDIKQAIITNDFLGKDLKTLLESQKEFIDGYDKLYQFFKENINKPFTTSELKRTHFKITGFSRDRFEREFEKMIEFVSTSAKEENFIFEEEKAQIKSKKTFTLKNKKEITQSENFKSLDNLVFEKQLQN